MAVLGPWRTPARCWLRRLSAAAWLGWLLLPVAAEAQTTATSEYQLKAVFLFNFTQFVEWPREAFNDPDEPLVIGVLGSDPFGPYLDQTVQGEKINGRSLEVRRYRNVTEVQSCHVLFIGPSEGPRLKDVLARLRTRSILTVGDTEGFAVNGGMIRFYSDRNRIRLRVNLDSVKAAGLTISSKLLRSAEIVSSQKN